MKEIISKKTKKVQIITDKDWDWIVAEGIKKRFTVRELPEKKLKEVPIIKPDEIKTKKSKDG